MDNFRRKLRSQTSDNMDRWKSRGGKSERREEQKREDQRRERLRRKKMQVREKVGTSRNTVFFQWFVAPEGRKVDLRRVRSLLARWEMKSCTPLWREAHVEVKMYKTPHVRTTLGSWDVKKVNAVVARGCAKHISKSKRTRHTSVGPLLEVEVSKKCTPFWREAHFEVKMYKASHVRSTFGSCDVEKVHAVVAQSTCPSQNVKSTTCSDHFWRFRCDFAWQAQGILHLVKSEQNMGFDSISKNDGKRGTFAEDLQRCISRGRRNTRDMFIRGVRRSGRWFPERGCILERQIMSDSSDL